MLDSFVYGAYVRLTFNIQELPEGSSLSGKLQRNGQTYNLVNTLNGNLLTMSSDTNTLEAGKYKFIILWYTVATGEPIEEEDFEIIIKARK